MKALLLAVFLLAPRCAEAESTLTGDLQVTGQLGVGTRVPQARLEVQMSSGDAYGLIVSSPNAQPMLLLDAKGRLGIGLSTPAAALDVRGSADNGDLGMLLRVGNSTSSMSSSQIVFAYGDGLYRSSVRTRASATQRNGNAIDFFLWRTTSSPTALGDVLALSLEATSGATSFHVLPAGTPDAEVEVSNGSSLGGGRMRYAAAGQHSARALKSDIAYLDNSRQAYEDVKALKHADFRYKGSNEMLRGLIYEESPEFIRGPGKSIVLDYRVLQLGAALQVVGRELERLEGEIARLEKTQGGRR